MKHSIVADNILCGAIAEFENAFSKYVRILSLNGKKAVDQQQSSMMKLMDVLPNNI